MKNVISPYKLAGLLITYVFFTLTSWANISLPNLISNGMVLQRNANVKIWGWATANEEISVQFIDSNYSAKANKEGNWNITLPQLNAGGPYTMELEGQNKIIIENIMIGDVWVCSGQSNMELSMKRVSPIYQEEISNSTNPDIRYFNVPQKYNFLIPMEDTDGGSWKEATLQNILDFSAVSYFFGKTLYDSIHVPIGLIHASLGGSPVEAWIDEESLKHFPKHYNEAIKFKNPNLIDSIKQQDQIRISTWYTELQKKDLGYQKNKNSWKNTQLNTSNWKSMTIPGDWKNTSVENKCGIVWFRKEIEIPANLVDLPAKIILGRIVDADSVFINGTFVGNTTYQYPPRRYNIPKGVLKAGKNTIVIKVISNTGQGIFITDKPYEIIFDDHKIDLKGIWKYLSGAETTPLASQTFIRWKPIGLYNGMIAPLQNYGIKGVIWYQGESNTHDPIEYIDLFQLLINSWRSKWKQGNFPFLFVQLPNYMEESSEPTHSNWAIMRESQAKALELPNTGMAVAIDLGEWNDIHPLNKKDVGKRLCWVAQNIAYNNTDIASFSPIYESMNITDNKITITFKNAGNGLIMNEGKSLRHFAIAGQDGRFVWAKAEIIAKDKVAVYSDKIRNPVAVRYAWADNPANVNLYNLNGLPAAPFRTDDW